MMRGEGKERCGQDGGGTGLCMVRYVSEQAGATKCTVRAAVEMSITVICRAIVAP